MNPSSVHAILLAAGAGRRFGGPKALLKLKGRWMLPRLVAALRAGGAEVVHLVLSPEAELGVRALGETGADQVHVNPDPDAGRTGSLLTALSQVPASAAVLCHPCDIPLLSADVVEALLSAWRGDDNRDDLLVRPVTPGGRGGHPLLLGANRVNELRTFPPDRPLREILQAHPNSIRDLRRIGDPGPFLDVDTPEQLALLESLLPS